MTEKEVLGLGVDVVKGYKGKETTMEYKEISEEQARTFFNKYGKRVKVS